MLADVLTKNATAGPVEYLKKFLSCGLWAISSEASVLESRKTERSKTAMSGWSELLSKEALGMLEEKFEAPDLPGRIEIQRLACSKDARQTALE